MAAEALEPEDLFDDWLAWLVLQHFLPARGMRSLAARVAREISGGTLPLDSLVEELVPATDLFTETWAVRMRPQSSELGYYLQRVIHTLVWRNDDEAHGFAAGPDTGARVSLDLVDWALRLGRGDYGWPLEELTSLTDREDLPPSFARYLAAFTSASAGHRSQDAAGFWRDVAEHVAALGPALRAMSFKHFADLCVDAGAVDRVDQGYVLAEAALDEWTAASHWSDVANAWRGLIRQSRASAANDLERANLELVALRKERALASSPLLLANTGLDALNASMQLQGLGSIRDDTRVAVVRAPLSLHSLESEGAFEAWLADKHDDAARRFWAVLRRQVAYGSATEARATKRWYARCLFDWVRVDLSKRTRVDEFRTACRLIVESEGAAQVPHVTWTEPLVDSCVDASTIALVQETARAVPSVRCKREVAVVALIAEWISVIDPVREDVVVSMARAVAALARDFDADLSTETDVGRPAFKALRAFARRFVGLRARVSGEVVDAVVHRLDEPGPFWGPAAACETATAFASGLDDHALARVLESVLALLGALDPASAPWPLSRPAIEFLTSDAVKRHVVSHPEVAERLVRELVRFGKGRGEDTASLLLQLRWFDPSLLSTEAMQAELAGPVANVRSGARDVKSSAASHEICALLLNPRVAGRDGIEAALDGLARILESTADRRPSFGLSVAYDGLLAIVEARSELASTLGSHEALVTGTARVLRALVQAWANATEKPAILAPFALPPRLKPDPVVVHNWAFASLQFAEVVGAVQQIADALARAEQNSELRAAIGEAKATRAMLDPEAAGSLSDLRAPDRETFYAGLGRRLVQIERSAPQARLDICRVLIEQCIRFGPREIDAAVLVQAARLDLGEHVRKQDLEGYRSRVLLAPGLADTLRPMIGIFRTPPTDDE